MEKPRCPVCNAELVKVDYGMGIESYCPAKPGHFKRVQDFSHGTDHIYREQEETNAAR